MNKFELIIVDGIKMVIFNGFFFFKISLKNWGNVIILGVIKCKESSVD